MAKFRASPDLDTTDFTEKVLPGAGAYVVTRFLSRATYKVAEKKTKAAKHVGALVGVGALAAAWAFGGRIRQLEKFYEPILIGSGVAAIQGVLQSYVPQYSWIVGDYLQEKKPATLSSPVSQNDYDSLLDDFEETPLGLPPAPTKAEEEEFVDSLSDYSEVNDTSFTT